MGFRTWDAAFLRWKEGYLEVLDFSALRFKFLSVYVLLLWAAYICTKSEAIGDVFLSLWWALDIDLLFYFLIGACFDYSGMMKNFLLFLERSSEVTFLRYSTIWSCWLASFLWGCDFYFSFYFVSYEFMLHSLVYSVGVKGPRAAKDFVPLKIWRFIEGISGLDAIGGDFICLMSLFLWGALGFSRWVFGMERGEGGWNLDFTLVGDNSELGDVGSFWAEILEIASESSFYFFKEYCEGRGFTAFLE